MMEKLKNRLKNESGAAIMIALFSVVLLTSIAMEIMYESNVELVVSSQAVNQVKAHYMAKSGVELSLLRIHIFRKVASMASDQIPLAMLDQIWQFPIMWPFPVPPEASAVDKDGINSAMKASFMNEKGTQFVPRIESEGSRIDINDLASTSKVVAENTHKQILQIFTSKVESDEEFANRHRGFEFEALVNNIADWVDEDKESRNGGDERTVYGERATDYIPPNQAFKTIDELHMVEGMTDEFYNLLEPRITIFGAKGINVNHASKEVLMSLSPAITEERADRILKDRSDPARGPFKDKADFVNYLGTIGVTNNPFDDKDPDKGTIPLLFDAEYNFRIESTGQAGKVQKEITAIVYDREQVKDRLKELMASQSPTPGPSPQPGAPSQPTGSTPAPAPSPTPAGKSKPKVPNERPNIVYWNET